MDRSHHDYSSMYDPHDPPPSLPPRPHDTPRRRSREGVKTTTSAGYARPQRPPPHRHYDRLHDSRHHYQPLYSSTRPVRKRRSWPPQPFAEDEVASLRRESNASKLLHEAGRDEAPSRGSLDQEPVIIDLPELMQQNNEPQASDSSGLPTPPTSEDERARKARRKPSKLNIHLPKDDAVPDTSRRTASPYAYTRPTDLSSTDRYTSHDTLTPPSSGVAGPKTARFASKSKPSSPLESARPSPGLRKGSGYFHAGHARNDNAIEDSEYSSNPAVARGNKSINDSKPSVVDFAPSVSAQPIRKLNLDARRNTDTHETLPTIGRFSTDKSRRTTPLVVSTSLSEARDANPVTSSSLNPQSADPASRSREPSYSSSRAVSPAASAAGQSPASRSPRWSSEFSQDGNVLGSRPPSASSSRPTSPSPRTPQESPRLARTELDWASLIAANAAAPRSKRPSRLASTVPQDPSPDRRRRESPWEASSASSSLPYPEDSTLMGSAIFMPEEQDHAYQPSRRPIITSYQYDQKSAYPSPVLSREPNMPSPDPSRPSLTTRGYSANNASPSELRSVDSRPRLAELKRTESYATTSEARKELAMLMKKGLPPCSRPDPVVGHDDWYTIIGATNIDFCPECIDTLFQRTVFRPHFRRSLPRSLNTRVRCAFGSPWIRLAWLLTLQQQRTDLSLLKDLAEIEDTTEPCPGSVETVQSWYGLRDPDGRFVRDFHVCFGDVRKIERLLPTLSGTFVKLPHRASSEKRICAIRTESNRFSAYLDALVATHEQAVANRKGADPMPLIDLVERKTRLRECTRDNMLIGGLWHFIPDLQSLTVCEDCFESVVEPEIKKGSSVAKRFNRTLQPVYGERVGSSCQLYSRRMRAVFRRAVEEADFKYLVRKSRERREAEVWLQDKYREVMRRAKRLSLEGEIGEDDERRLNRELEKISSEWKSKWE
ncbi:Hypothetical predicted protein [Lecanosticta acicola]|uniref:Uncharacterized protein n=1 Tax=Lecanosticta acicola TaxID=111012 RepID=A0AAI8Z386_9PEZI|nr:Hypothetical predicted protein [Lecanosticta acicola]